MLIRAYLRASTQEQDASRAKEDLAKFVEERGLKIAATYVENESGASLKRPELFRLLNDCHAGDVLLVEQVDRLSRLNGEDWDKLKSAIKANRVKVVSLDLPTSWAMVEANNDSIQSRIFEAINDMMLDVLAAVARKDYEDRRRRQAQGIDRARMQGAFKGRPEDEKRNEAIMKMLSAGQSWSTIIKATKCSRSTVARLSGRLKQKLST